MRRKGKRVFKRRASRGRRGGRRLGRGRKGLRRMLYVLTAAFLVFFAGRYLTPGSWELPWWVTAKLPQQLDIWGWQVPDNILAGLRGTDEFLRRQADGLRRGWQSFTGQGLEIAGVKFWKNTGGGGSMPLPEAGQLTVDFLDVGQGDCALIQVDGHAMLFDCGPDDTGTYVQNYLQKQGIDTLDYVIGSHPDEDHIGGMDVVVSKFDCGTILMPETEKDGKSARDAELAMNYRGYQAVAPWPGQVYELGDAFFTVLGPVSYYENDTNNNSIAVRLVYGSVSFLFTGDAEKEEEADLAAEGLELKSDVYQVGHHGSSTASSWEFLREVSPAYAVISCGAENRYGHPHEEVLERLAAVGSAVYRTDRQGTVRAVSDGESIRWSTER